MTRHGSYWNNIIIARVATSFFFVSIFAKVTTPYPFMYDCFYDIWNDIFLKYDYLLYYTQIAMYHVIAITGHRKSQLCYSLIDSKTT